MASYLTPVTSLYVIMEFYLASSCVSRWWKDNKNTMVLKMRGLIKWFRYYGLFHQQLSRKGVRTGRSKCPVLDICKFKGSLDHSQLISDLHLKVYTSLLYVIMSPSPCEVLAICDPDIGTGRGAAWNQKIFLEYSNIKE